MSIFSGLLEGVNAGIEKQRQEKKAQADTEAENAKAKGMEILKGIIGGDIEETQNTQEAVLTQPGEIIKRGLFGKTETAPGRMYRRGSNLERQYKESQLELNKKIIESYGRGNDSNRTFRDLRTGEEIDEASALAGMQEGKQYNVFLKTPTKGGLRETKIAEPQKLSEDQVSFVSAYKERSKDLDDLIEKLTPETKAPLGGFARISTRKRYLVPEENLRKLQAPYTRVIQAFLFGPAGKALTGTEREVLEKAASPTGKSPEEWEKDLVSAKNTLDDKYNYLTTGQLPVGIEKQKQQPVQKSQSIKSKYTDLGLE